MGDVRIKGGSKDTPVSVGEDGRLRTLATGHTAFLAHSLSGDAFVILAEVDLLTTNLEPLLWLKNNDTTITRGSERVLVIDNVIFSQDAKMHYEIFSGLEYTSGGGPAVVENVNESSSKTAQVTANDAKAGAMVLSGTGIESGSLFLQADVPWKFKPNRLLAKDKTFTVKAQGAIGNKCRVHVFFYFTSLADAE